MNKVKKFALEMFSKEELETAIQNFESTENAEEQKEEVQKFGEVALADGSGNIFYPGDELTVGTPIYQEDQETPLEDGEYTLEDGVTVVVSEGAVAEIMTEGEEEAPAEEAPADEEAKKENNTLEEVFEALAPVFEKYDEAIATLTGTVEELMAALKENNEKVEKMAAIPAAKHETKAVQPRKTENFQKNLLGSSTRNKHLKR